MTVLRLTGLEVDAFSDLVQLLQCFPQAEWLTIAGGWLSFNQTDILNGMTSHSMLSRLKGLHIHIIHRDVDVNPLQTLVEWFTSSTPLSALSNIHWDFALGSELEIMTRFLNTLGASLEHFRVSSSGHWHQELTGKRISRNIRCERLMIVFILFIPQGNQLQDISLFQFNTRLQSIHLEPSGSMDNAHLLDLFHSLLAKISSSPKEMTRVSLEYVVSISAPSHEPDDAYTNPTWALIDGLLDTHSEFPHLQAVEIFLTRYDGGGDAPSSTHHGHDEGRAIIPTAVREILKKHSLPRCSARGLLKIYDSSHPRTYKMDGRL